MAWQHAIEYHGPTCLLFSRQNLVHQERNTETLANITRGAYTLMDCEGVPELILIATGSELDLAVNAAKELIKANIKVRVVSMPSTDTFLSQDLIYQESVLPKNVKARIAIEAASSDGWYKFVGCRGKIIGLDHFGASAPAKDLFKAYGFTVEHIIAEATKLLKENIEEETLS